MAEMLIGLVFSAIMGGLAGTAWSVARDCDLVQVLASYPLGGFMAVLAFVLLTSLRADPRGTAYVRGD